ncbi:MAG: HPr family phosphocarrier protein [Succinivibrionaceae bacterium]
MVIELDVEVNGKHGLHIRPCASIVKLCSKYTDVKVKVKNLSEDSMYIDAKSMMQISSLRASYGQKLHFVFDGDRAKELAELVMDFFSRLD